MRRHAIGRLLSQWLVAGMLVVAAGCARTSAVAGKRPAEIIAETEKALKEAEKLGAAQTARDDYGKAQQLLQAAQAANQAGNARAAAKQGGKAYVMAQTLVERGRATGPTALQIAVEPAGRALQYRYSSLDRTNHLLLIFEATPKVEQMDIRGPVQAVEAKNNVVDLALGERVHVRQIRREGEAVEVIAARRGAFWPVIVCLFADMGVAQHMNRGDAFKALDVVLFLPYIQYIPRIIYSVGVANGAVGVVSESEKTGFRKTGELGAAGPQLTVRCRFVE